MQALQLHITFSVNTYSPASAGWDDRLHPSFVADWDGNRATGVCALPYRRDEVPHLQSLLSAYQSEDDYEQPNHYADFEWSTLERHGLADPALGPSGQVIAHPIRSIGRTLYSALFGENTGLSDLFKEFLRSTVSEGYRLLALHFVRTSHERDITRELLALPWEALWNPENPNYPVSLWEPDGQQPGGLVIVRTYHSSAIRLRQPETKDPSDLGVPTLLTLLPKIDMDAAVYREHELKARPPVHMPSAPAGDNSGPPVVWCNMPEPAPGLTAPEINALVEQHQPQILHYFGHGSFEQELFAFAVDDTAGSGAQPYEPQAALVNWRSRGVRLLAAFACHSGSVDTAHALIGADEPNASLVTTMAEDLPAMLLMQTPIAVDVAAVASRAFYSRLAAGQSVVSAVHALREALFDPSRSPRPEHAWWVPVLYLRDVHDDLVFVEPGQRTHLRLGKAEGWIAFERHDQLRQRIVKAIDTPGVIQVQGDPNSGKTALLQRIVRELEESKRPYIALRACTDPSCPVCKDFDSRARLEALQREIACYIEYLQGKHIEWSKAHEHYDACAIGYTGTQPITVIIDNIDHKTTPENINQLLSTTATSPIACIVASKINFNLSRVKIPIKLPNYEIKEWKTIKKITYDVYSNDKNLVTQRNSDKWFDFFCCILFGIRTHLKAIEIAEIANSIGIITNDDTIYKPARILADFVRINEDDRYELYDPSMHQEWIKDHKAYDYLTIIKAIEQWRNSRANTPQKLSGQKSGVRNYPACLLEIIADEEHRHDIEPFESEPQYKLTAPWLHGWPYGGWEELARRYQDERLTKQFVDLVEFRCSPKRDDYTRLDRALLQLFAWRIQQEEQQHVANAAYLWAAYLPELRYRTRAWLEQYREGKPGLMRLLESALQVANDAGQIGQLIALLNEPDLQAERAFGLRFVVVPALHPERTEQLLALVESLQDGLIPIEQAALSRGIAVAFRDQPDHTLMALARQWCDQLCDSQPRLAVPLVLALAPTLQHDQQKRYVDRILPQLPGILDIAREDPTISEVDQLIHASFLYYHASYESIDKFRAELEPGPSNQPAGSVHKKQLDFVHNALKCESAAVLKSIWERLKSDLSSFGSALDALAAYIRCSIALQLDLHLVGDVLGELGERAFENLSDPVAVAQLMVHPAVTFRHERATCNAVRRRLALHRRMLLATVAEQDAEMRRRWFAAYMQEFHSAPLAAGLASLAEMGESEPGGVILNTKLVSALVEHPEILLEEHIDNLKEMYAVDEPDEHQLDGKCQVWREQVETRIGRLLALYNGASEADQPRD